MFGCVYVNCASDSYSVCMGVCVGGVGMAKLCDPIVLLFLGARNDDAYHTAGGQRGLHCDRTRPHMHLNFSIQPLMIRRGACLNHVSRDRCNHAHMHSLQLQAARPYDYDTYFHKTRFYTCTHHDGADTVGAGGGGHTYWEAGGTRRGAPGPSTRDRMEASVRGALARHPSLWDVRDVCNWVEVVGFEQYRKKFAHNWWVPDRPVCLACFCLQILV